jgi:hypothetical protein
MRLLRVLPLSSIRAHAAHLIDFELVENSTAEAPRDGAPSPIRDLVWMEHDRERSVRFSRGSSIDDQS